MNARCDICRAPVFFTTYEEVPECPYCLRVLSPKHEKFGFCEEHFSRLTEADQQAIIHLAKDIEKTNVKLTIYSVFTALLILLLGCGPLLLVTAGMEYALFHLLWIPIGVGTARLGLLWKRAKETKEKFLVQRQETIIKYPQQRPPVSMKILNAKNQIRCSICNLLVGVEERKTNGGLCKRHFSELSEQDRAYFSMLFRSYAFTKWRKIGLYILFILVGFVTIVLSLLVGGFTSIALWGLFTFSALSTSTGIILFFVTTPEDREREWKRFLGGKIFTEIGIKSWESPNGLEETLKPCNSCGRENPHDAHYCNICGKVLD